MTLGSATGSWWSESALGSAVVGSAVTGSALLTCLLLLPGAPLPDPYPDIPLQLGPPQPGSPMLAAPPAPSPRSTTSTADRAADSGRHRRGLHIPATVGTTGPQPGGLECAATDHRYGGGGSHGGVWPNHARSQSFLNRLRQSRGIGGECRMRSFAGTDVGDRRAGHPMTQAAGGRDGMGWDEPGGLEDASAAVHDAGKDGPCLSSHLSTAAQKPKRQPSHETRQTSIGDSTRDLVGKAGSSYDHLTHERSVP